MSLNRIEAAVYRPQEKRSRVLGSRVDALDHSHHAVSRHHAWIGTLIDAGYLSRAAPHRDSRHRLDVQHRQPLLQVSESARVRRSAGPDEPVDLAGRAVPPDPAVVRGPLQPVARLAPLWDRVEGSGRYSGKARDDEFVYGGVRGTHEVVHPRTGTQREAPLAIQRPVIHPIRQHEERDPGFGGTAQDG